MLKIDNNLLQELGLGQLPDSEKNSLLKHVYETLEMRVGMRLADQMSNEQLDEFERYFEAKDDAGAFKWLEGNFPNYKEIVQEEFDKLKSEVGQSAPQILSAAQAQMAAGVQPPVDSTQAGQTQPQMQPQQQPQPVVQAQSPMQPPAQPQFAQPMQSTQAMPQPIAPQPQPIPQQPQQYAPQPDQFAVQQPQQPQYQQAPPQYAQQPAQPIQQPQQPGPQYQPPQQPNSATQQYPSQQPPAGPNS